MSASFEFYVKDFDKEFFESCPLIDKDKWILDVYKFSNFPYELMSWEKKQPSQEVLDDLKIVINNCAFAICPNNNTRFYELLVHYGLDAEEHKKCVKNKKIGLLFSLICGGDIKHFTRIVGIYDSEREAIEALIEYVVVNEDYFIEEYEVTGPNQYHSNFKYIKDKQKDVKKLAERFKIERDGMYLQQLMSIESSMTKVVNSVHHSWYWDMQSIG